MNIQLVVRQYIKQIKSLYHNWRKEQKQNGKFFKETNGFKQETFHDAVYSFTTYLHEHEITLNEVEQILWYFKTRKRVANIMWPIMGIMGINKLLPHIATKIIGPVPTVQSWLSMVITILLWIAIFICIVACLIPEMTQVIMYDSYTLIYYALQTFREKYANEKPNFIALQNGMIIQVPPAEPLYATKITNSIYYNNAYQLEIRTPEHNFKYVLYTNESYTTSDDKLYEDVRSICEQQIGISWHSYPWNKVSKEHIDIQKLNVISNTDSCNPKTEDSNKELAAHIKHGVWKSLFRPKQYTPSIPKCGVMLCNWAMTILFILCVLHILICVGIATQMIMSQNIFIIPHTIQAVIYIITMFFVRMIKEVYRKRQSD